MRPRISSAEVCPGVNVFWADFIKQFNCLYFRVFCNSTYLVPDCKDTCVPTNDASGHYTCDYQDGVKVCISGWKGENCLEKIKYCTAKDGASGHYTCNNVTKEMTCLPGWTNTSSNCTQGRLILKLFHFVILLLLSEQRRMRFKPITC